MLKALSNLYMASVVSGNAATRVAAAPVSFGFESKSEHGTGNSIKVTLTVTPRPDGTFQYPDITAATYNYPGRNGSIEQLQPISSGQVNAAGNGFASIYLVWSDPANPSAARLEIGTKDWNFVQAPADGGVATWAPVAGR